MKYITKEIKPGILDIELIAESAIETNLFSRTDRDRDELIDVYYQDAVSKYNSSYELLQIIDISKWPTRAVVKYEVVK